MQFHQDKTLPTDGLEGTVDKSWVFVFGSNLAGIHGAGAAKVARQEFGAQSGVGKGRTGMAYAIPTKDEHLVPLSHEDIREFVERFITYVELNPHEKYWMTRVGCGLAGNEDVDIAPMFSWLATQGHDISWPADWRKYLEE